MEPPVANNAFQELATVPTGRLDQQGDSGDVTSVRHDLKTLEDFGDYNEYTAGKVISIDTCHRAKDFAQLYPHFAQLSLAKPNLSGYSVVLCLSHLFVAAARPSPSHWGIGDGARKLLSRRHKDSGRMWERLKAEVAEANRRLSRERLVTLTWGNVSAISEDRKAVAIKPSGVPYEELTSDDIVVLGLDGTILEGKRRPSTDTPTHLAIYRGFEHVRGICHTHSRFATVFSQWRQEIPCFGTTHADYFCGPVPVTRVLSPTEVEEDYELNTGKIIIERFRVGGLDPLVIPGVLVAGHGPFTFGRSAHEAVDVAVALEEVAALAWHLLLLESQPSQIEGYILQKHYQRKHGPKAYYGQDDHRI